MTAGVDDTLQRPKPEPLETAGVRPALAPGVKTDVDAFVRRLSKSLSLEQHEKLAILEALPTLPQASVDEVQAVLADYETKLDGLVTTEGDTPALQHLMDRRAAEWRRLRAGWLRRHPTT